MLHALKPLFLAEMAQLAPDPSNLWIILGDFNLMRSQSDKNSDSFRQNEADAFNDMIHALALIDLPLLKKAYTWSNNRDQPTLQRIDRVFINQSWAKLSPTHLSLPLVVFSLITYHSSYTSPPPFPAPPISVSKIAGPSDQTLGPSSTSHVPQPICIQMVQRTLPLPPKNVVSRSKPGIAPFLPLLITRQTQN